ncbi:molybdopterin-dependent oxidoreductase [Paraburkholderia caballeronis]|uniref:molybdopterin-dependent oxidoreductase n=1 Tax=Paraburkholderia caballeronis TaxID=416943 RepID=UPI00106583BF|nr:molybdopterin-dependent oxidoreductase [Paraburkholderia caballeronis]TDV11395.1 hypothetical protein C7408_11243 [Paraburkholderia caballeronis]TDV14585.1 hypothetical protein C7406_11343 [Paraburkholderia caballeronis]TDV23656.1 hypothetical protein C7404_11243 [Paraburkholderia caballeronis]
MNKRQFLTGAALLGAAASPAFAASNAKRAGCAASPVLLTVSGAIDRHNRGPLDPTFDRLLDKQMVRFPAAYAFDYPTLASLPAVTIEPTLEYDAKPHRLSGPLLTDVLRHVGAHDAPGNQIMLRAIDGYAAATTFRDARDWNFIVATHMDGAPLALGGLGPLWALYDADRIPAFAAKPLKERFEACPWALYHVAVVAA